MKCTICGRRTLLGAKLCMPCRSALRRARDDTVSELLPLPRRLEAMAFPGAHTVSRALDARPVRHKTRRPQDSVAAAPALLSGEHKSPMRIAAIALFSLAAGFLAYGFAHQLRGDSQISAIREAIEPEVTPLHSSVSPATLAAEAWRSTVLAPLPSAAESLAESRPADPPAVATIKARKNPPKPARPATIVATVQVADAPAEAAPIVVAAALPAPKP